jgi:hypothetical protein
MLYGGCKFDHLFMMSISMKLSVIILTIFSFKNVGLMIFFLFLKINLVLLQARVVDLIFLLKSQYHGNVNGIFKKFNY